jgi:hypothetical protein
MLDDGVLKIAGVKETLATARESGGKSPANS